VTKACGGSSLYIGSLNTTRNDPSSGIMLMITRVKNCLYRVLFRRYRPLKLPLSCKVVGKKVVLGPRFVEGGDTPDFERAFSNRNYFRAFGRFWLDSVQRPWRLGGEKRRRKKKESLVKHKSADILYTDILS